MRVPRPVPGCDIRSLPLKPAEAYLLSRVDATISERELASMTGLSPADVAAGLDRLFALGAIDFGGEYKPPRPSGPMAAPGAAKIDGKKQPTPPTGISLQTPGLGRGALETSSASPPLYDPAELDEEVEVDKDKRRRILDVFYRLEEYTYYELLGVPDQADKKQIKSAYYLMAPEFHPDKFFRKQLGSYKQKIEAIFNRITLAHDVLTNKQRRGEYDDYLEQTHRNRTMAALLEQTTRDIATVASAVDQTAAAIVARSSVAPPSPGRYTADPRPPESIQSRRETLARKLGGPNLRLAGGTAVAPPSPAAEPAGRPEDALRVRYESARAEAKRQQIARFVESGRAALERKDYAAAANAYRIAASLDPEDEALQRSSAEVEHTAAEALAEGFLRQAEYEASQERWIEAALSFSKAAAGMPGSARVHERVAFATLKSSGNSRRAIEFARRAVELSPKEAEYHVTLARAYLAAGLEKSAVGELDRAAELAPKDARIRELIRLARVEPQHKDGKVG